MNEMKDSAVQVIDFLKRWLVVAWVSGLRPILGHVNWFFLVGLAIIAISSICLVLTHICLEFNKVPPGILQWTPNLILWFFGTDSAQLSQGGHYAVIIADMIAICAFVFAVLPWIQGVHYKIKIKRDIQEKFGFEFIPVKEQGKDDLVEMLKRYRGADHLTIFCGGFDWLGEDHAMRDEIVKLANDQKLKLISFRSEQDVQRQFEEKGYGELFSTLKNALKTRFRFNSGLQEIKCSVIRFLGGAKYRFLFRQSSENHPFNAGFLGSSEYSRELLLILQQFATAKEWGEPPADFGEEVPQAAIDEEES